MYISSKGASQNLNTGLLSDPNVHSVAILPSDHLLIHKVSYFSDQPLKTHPVTKLQLKTSNAGKAPQKLLSTCTLHSFLEKSMPPGLESKGRRLTIYGERHSA